MIQDFFFHRLKAAFLAISLRLAALMEAARAFPPFEAPSSPKATAAGFLGRSWPWPVVKATILEAAERTSSISFKLARVGIIRTFARTEGVD